jgi:hypothetical protein
MTTRFRRQRIHPTWRGGLRRGRARNEAALAFLKSPAMMEILRDADEQLRAWGVEPMVLEGIRQPFDYAPRMVPPAARRIH